MGTSKGGARFCWHQKEGTPGGVPICGYYLSLWVDSICLDAHFTTSEEQDKRKRMPSRDGRAFGFVVQAAASGALSTPPT